MEKKVNYWLKFNVAGDKTIIGLGIVLNLKGKALDAVLEIDENIITSETGVEEILRKLDELFKEDKAQAALICYDKFERYSRPSEMTITDYLIEFERMTAKLKDHDISLPEPVLAYRALRIDHVFKCLTPFDRRGGKGPNLSQCLKNPKS